MAYFRKAPPQKKKNNLSKETTTPYSAVATPEHKLELPYFHLNQRNFTASGMCSVLFLQKCFIYGCTLRVRVGGFVSSGPSLGSTNSEVTAPLRRPVCINTKYIHVIRVNYGLTFESQALFMPISLGLAQSRSSDCMQRRFPWLEYTER